MKVYLTISLVSTETIKHLVTCIASLIGYIIIILGRECLGRRRKGHIRHKRTGLSDKGC